MPSPAARHRGSIIRQLSLQSQPNVPPPAGRRGLKKQLSEDYGRDRGLDSVEVTGHGWSIKSAASLQAGSSDNAKHGQPKMVNATRPRPVKLAWADRKQDGTECPTGVEVVARKCQGQPRPVTSKAQRITTPTLPSEKDTLVYTRQQLAERLRMAWREREKNKPNLNIFLAHAAEGVRRGVEEPDTGRSNGVHCEEILVRDSVSFRSVSTSESSFSSGTGRTEAVSNAPCVRFEGEKIPALRNNMESELKSILKNARSQSKQAEGRDSDREKIPKQGITESPDFKTFPVGESSTAFGNNLTNLKYRMKSPDSTGKLPDEKDKENSSPRSDSGYSERSKIELPDDEVPCKILEVGEVRSHGTAEERRASFRRGSLLNKAVDENSSPPESSEEIEDDIVPGRKNEIKVFLKRNEDKRPPMVRTFSAPTRNDSPKSIQNSANGNLCLAHKTSAQFTSSVDLVGMDEDAVASRGRIKSAPIRRKLKTAAARRKHRGGKEPDSSDDEKPCLDEAKKKVSRRKMSSKTNAADIVTMVSLVSPATTDTEESAIALPAESWAAEDKEEKTKAEDAGEVQPPKETSSFVVQKFVSLRRTNKTVSFVQHPPINRSYSASFPSRRAPAGTPIIIPTPVVTNPALTPAQLQEREKRPQPPSPGVSAGTDNRGIKRRLIRTASAPQVKDRNEENDSSVKKEVDLGDLRRKDIEKIDESKEEESEEKREPEFKTPKERECWMLYQKMVEKGVSVSFDTVLRGMLTPTEYRLRRNQLLSSC